MAGEYAHVTEWERRDAGDGGACMHKKYKEKDSARELRERERERERERGREREERERDR